MTDWNRTVWTARALVALAWTAFCIVAGLAWVAGVAANPEPDDAVKGAAIIITAGCSGMCWTLGLVPILLVAALLRRTE